MLLAHPYDSAAEQQNTQWLQARPYASAVEQQNIQWLRTENAGILGGIPPSRVLPPSEKAKRKAKRTARNQNKKTKRT